MGAGFENSVGAVKTDGTLWTWGKQADSGHIGHNNRTDYSSPKQVPGTTWSRVLISDNSSLMFTEA